MNDSRHSYTYTVSSGLLASGAVLLLSLSWLGGCETAEPREHLPLTDVPPLTSPGAYMLPERWWEELGDPDLDRSVEAAVLNNFSLRVAYERIREARAVAGISGAARSPELIGTAGAALRDGNGSDDGRSEISLGLEASYEVDLWGRIGSEIEADELEAIATVEDYRAAAVSLSAELATALYRRNEAVLQLDLLGSQLRTNENMLSVLEDRFAIGQSGSADVLRQRQLVEATREQEILTRASLGVLERQILTLLGQPAQASEGLPEAGGLPELPPVPGVGLPSELLQRRPDVRAAFFRIESADAAVAASVKDRYPALRIGASLSSAASNPARLLDSWIAAVLGELVAPIVDGGQRVREIERRTAIRRQRVATYGETVLGAFQEVEDAISLERHQASRIENLARQLELAGSTYTQLRSEYLNGAADFIDVLVALRDRQDLERSVLSARLSRIEYRIALYRAIAGGFVDDVDGGNSMEDPWQDHTVGEQR